MAVFDGDISALALDAIVNAANEHLAPGAGVCGAIHRALSTSAGRLVVQTRGMHLGALFLRESRCPGTRETSLTSQAKPLI
jgi:O-acetyl-ADP-ribose deacetylase (regulator of RNase III)